METRTKKGGICLECVSCDEFVPRERAVFGEDYSAFCSGDCRNDWEEVWD